MKISIYKFTLLTFFVFYFFNIGNAQEEGVDPNERILPVEVNIPGKRILSPCISFDGRHIIFIAKSEGLTLAMTSEKSKDGNWNKPIPVKPVNDAYSTDYIIESPSMNADGTMVHFSVRKRESPDIGDIYSVQKSEGVWGAPVKLPNIINEFGHYQTDPSLSLDGNTLYFARLYENDDIDDYKCAQIFMATKENGIWNNSILLPSPVNDGCDRSPRICADGKTLYISSVRGENKTGLEIFYTKQLAENVWTTPIAVTEINTEHDEVFPSVDFRGEKMYFIRGKGKKQNRTDQVYAKDLPAKYRPAKMIYLHGKITDLKTNNPLYSKINVIDPNTSVILQEIQADEKTGDYRILFHSGKKFRIDYFREGYSHHFYDFETTGSNMSAEIQKDVKLYSSIELIMNVYDQEIYEPLDSKILVKDKTTGKKVNCKTDKISNGRYKLTLPIGKNYEIHASKKFYEPNSFDLNLTRTVQFDEFERDLELKVRKVDVGISLINEETGEGVLVDIEITNLSTNEKIIQTASTGTDGKVKVNLRDGNKYAISVNPRGYAFYNTTLELDTEEDPEPTIVAKLTPLTTLTKIELKDITFEFNSADLDESSYIELANVIKLMLKNPQIKMEISAHTDDVGSQKYNVKLSGKRAASVAGYILTQGIPVEQLVSKGYGKAEPKYLPANSEENRAKNRRVELKILEISN